MKHTIALCLLSLGFFTISKAQDFYGAEFTGKHTVGAYVTYNGDVSVGLQYNIKKFNGPFNRPVYVNFNTGIQLDKGLSKVDLSLGTYQIYADGGNDFNPSFGLGTGLEFKGDYCLRDREKVKGVDGKTPCDFSLSGDVKFRPGYYANKYNVSAIADVNFLRLGFGESKLVNDNSPKVEVAAFKKYDFGAHFDYVNKFGNSVHLTYDIENTVYAVKEIDKKAWGSLGSKHYDGIEVKADYPDCAIPEMNLEQRFSLSASF